jgi:hypothetical protein
MRLGAYLIGLAAVVLVPSMALAQDPGPVGPYVVDLHVAMAGLPKDPAFFPSVPSGTFVPTRSLGLDVGGHVYPLRIGPARLGIGASLARTTGRASPPQPGTTSSSPPPRQTSPDVDSTMTTLAPQLSLNFGSSTGWSYISAGLGQTRIRSTASPYAAGGSSSASTVEEKVLELQRRQTINFGGGARWFLSTHVAFSFDVRFHMIAARATEEARTPKATTIVAGAGLSFR